MIARLHDILVTPKPYERKVLLWLAAVRAIWTAGVGVGLSAAAVFAPVPPWLAAVTYQMPVWSVVLIATVGVALGVLVAALFSADFFEHYAKRWLLGYTYNPRIMAMGEWEGWTGYLPGQPGYRALWEQHKFDVLYYKDADGTFNRWVCEGDPGSGRFGGE